MAEFIGGNEKDISVGEPIFFENKTESKYEVCAGVVFHKSGIYQVSIVGNRTIVSDVMMQKTGKWIPIFDEENSKCSICGKEYWCPETKGFHFCPNCGSFNGGADVDE